MNELSTTAPEHDASPERQQRARRAANAAGESHRRRCAEADAKVAPIIRELRQQGKTLEEIGLELAARGYVTRRGYTFWHRRQVARVLQRAGQTHNHDNVYDVTEPNLPTLPSGLPSTVPTTDADDAVPPPDDPQAVSP